MYKKLFLLFLCISIIEINCGINPIFMYINGKDRPFNENNYKNNELWKKYIIIGVWLGCGFLGKYILKIIMNKTKSAEKPVFDRGSSFPEVSPLKPTSDNSPERSNKDNSRGRISGLFLKIPHETMVPSKHNPTPFVSPRPANNMFWKPTHVKRESICTFAPGSLSSLSDQEDNENLSRQPSSDSDTDDSTKPTPVSTIGSEKQNDL